MRSASDIWYLIKLVIKTITFFVIFGTLGWAYFTNPPWTPPRTEAELREWGEALLPKLEFVSDNAHWKDIASPKIDEATGERRIWGPWRNAEDKRSWTAYDSAYAERIRAGKAVGRSEGKASRSTAIEQLIVDSLNEKRERSRTFCADSEASWLDMERKKLKMDLSFDGFIELDYIRYLQAECRYWKTQAQYAETN